jgi:GR25 family glycosyltransferase involved in LPS biosynthesis
MFRFLWISLAFVSCFADIEDYYRKVQNTAPPQSFRKIDNVYVINLGYRPERWQTCLMQMNRYDVIPQRFPGIYGWDLAPEQLNNIGLVCESWMWNSKAPVIHFPEDKHGHPVWLKFGETCYGKTIFYGWLTKGTIGRSLSHLSILKGALEAGYKTIWVMEDEAYFLQDPHVIDSVIEQLDDLIGSDGWDVLYTDSDYLQIDPNLKLFKQIHHILRPDIAAFNPHIFSNINTYFTSHRDLGPEFMRINGRGGTHSIIYRTSGMKKILKFYQEHRLFTDYAAELSLIPYLRLFVVKNSITNVAKTPSDADEHYFPDHNGKIVSPWDKGTPWPQ